MKKLLCIVLMLVLLAGCSPMETASGTENKQNYITGVWVSYSELDTMLAGDFKAEFNTTVQNCVSRGITDMFVHVRPFCDSYYPSEYYPLRSSAAAQGFDALEYMINACHNSGIKFHAWINTYR